VEGRRKCQDADDERKQAVLNLSLLDVYMYDAFWEPEVNFNMPDDLSDVARQVVAEFMGRDGQALRLPVRHGRAIAESVFLNFGTATVTEPLGRTIGEIEDTHRERVSLLMSPNMGNENSLATEHLVDEILDSTLKSARDCEATHIHIEPFGDNFRVRLRIGGSFSELSNHPLELLPSLVKRVKALSEMDVAETRLPQSGRLRRDYPEGSVDFPVQSQPGQAGEHLTMGNVWTSLLRKELDQLGMEEHQLDAYRQATIQSPAGLVILAGPTGSGKNSTAYATLRTWAKQGRSLATAEWVEWGELIPGVNHAVVNEQIGMNFVAWMRQYRRADLDAVYIREIPDFETAEIVIQAVVEHNMLVLTCMHTHDSISTLSRLAYMRIEPWLVSTAASLIQAQRVLRKLCPACKKEVKIPLKVLIEAGFPPDEAETLRTFQPAGCRLCGGSGYRGTLMVAESLPFTALLKEAVLSGMPHNEFRQLALKQGLQTLRRSALNRLREGQTSLDQVILRTPDFNEVW
jgi:type IV pilus assembly protein PilB